MARREEHLPFKVANIERAHEGEIEMAIAERDMPGLMELRQRYGELKTLMGARIAAYLPITINNAVMIETLAQLGAEVRCACSSKYNTQDHAAAALANRAIAVYAWYGQTDEEHRWCIDQIFIFHSGDPFQILIDEDCTITSLVHSRYNQYFAECSGIVEETANGAIKVSRLLNSGTLRVPVMVLDDSVLKTRFGCTYGCGESVVDAIRQTGVTIAGKVCIVAGYGNVGKATARSLRTFGGHVYITEIDPISALQAVMDGFKVIDMDCACNKGQIFVTATGNIGILAPYHFLSMKNFAIICNVGKNKDEVDVNWLRSYAGHQTIRPRIEHYILGNSNNNIIVLSDGLLANINCVPGHSSFIMSITLCCTVMAIIELWTRDTHYSIDVHRLPRTKEEDIAKIHAEHLGVKLTRLNLDQQEYTGLSPNGPFKSNFYRY